MAFRPGEGLAVEPHRTRHRIQARTVALGTDLAFLRPTPPAFLDGIRIRTTLDIGDVKQFTEPAALRAPAGRRVVTEILRVQRLESTVALQANALCAVDTDAAAFV